MKRLGALLLFLFLAGCRQEFDDISFSEKYKDLVGNKYSSIKPLRIHEVTMDRNYKKIPDHYTLTKPPGIGGPEVIFSGDIPIGKKLKIRKVLQCSNCWFGSPIVIAVDLEEDSLKEGIPVFLYGFRIEDSDGLINLDPSYFKKLEELKN